MKFNLKDIAWKELPKETFTTEVNGQEYEVEVQALDGQAMIELERTAETKRISFLLSKGLGITIQEAEEVVKHDLNFASEASKRILNLSLDYHKMMNEDDRGKSLTITDLQST